VTTYPIKKRINTELFIDTKLRLYVQSSIKERIKKLSDLIKEGNCNRRESKNKNENINGSLFGMTTLEGKKN